MGMNDMIRFFQQMTGKLGSNIYAGMSTHSNPQQISFLRQLQKEMKEENSLDCPLEELPVTVFDLETTGFYPEKGDRIISIGAVKVIGSTILDREVFYSLINPEISVPTDVLELTSITEEELLTAPMTSQVLMDFLNFIGSSVLVAHHAKHEQAFMKKFTSSHLRVNFSHRVIDTSFLIRIFQPVVNSLPLEQICLECGIEVKSRHHALEDAKLAAKLWAFYIKKSAGARLPELAGGL
ncbi:exonuclease domain-containing protein [Mesobacillus subterraneus]|uniref:exonuclease domain-containing protein n=1 Tax=Mesobacillus subterraneus TaxID=285983 RepID=UPI00273EE6D7|nr:exonuclease domain-containing protein [Mesobacillus subterraneus]WLR57121.1 exonuclease domain-containing protein [Mesobacillus subterraneus]